MTQDGKRVASVEDRISVLPSNVIDHILEMLPVHDAARTSILSKIWRYIWAMLPNLVLDNNFCSKLAVKSQNVFKETIDMILLQHIGGIVKFDLDVSRVQLSSYADIDRWMLYVTRNGVKRLTLNMSNNISTTYKVPSYIFNCQTLTHLTLFKCIFKPPNSFLGFDNLITLHLERITFVPATEFCAINAPLLIDFTLKYCDGVQYLDVVVSTRLKYLFLRDNLNLNRFANCKNLTTLFLVMKSSIPADERSSYENFILSLSKLETLILSSFVVELLSTGKLIKGLPFTLINCLSHLVLDVNLDQMSQTSYALELIKSFPNLSKLQISVCVSSDNNETVMKYLDKPTCLDRSLNKLEDVVIHLFRGSKTELLFIKLLFAFAPSLVRMNIKQWRGTKEERRIPKELMRFPRASPKAELFYSTNAD